MVTAWISTESPFAYEIWVVSFNKIGDTMFTWNQHYSRRGYIYQYMFGSIINIIILAMGKAISLAICLNVFSKLGFGFFIWGPIHICSSYILCAHFGQQHKIY
jgi:hypothetical protein